MKEFKSWYREMEAKMIASRAVKLEKDLMDKLSYNQLHEFNEALGSMNRGNTHIGIDFAVNRYDSGNIHRPNITRTIKLDSEDLEYFTGKYMSLYDNMKKDIDLRNIKSLEESINNSSSKLSSLKSKYNIK